MGDEQIKEAPDPIRPLVQDAFSCSWLKSGSSIAWNNLGNILSFGGNAN